MTMDKAVSTQGVSMQMMKMNAFGSCLAAALLAGCASAPKIDAPANNPAPFTLPELEVSSVTVPINLNLDAAQTELMKRAPSPLAAGSEKRTVQMTVNNPLAAVAGKPGCNDNSLSCLASKALGNAGASETMNLSLPVEARFDYQTFLRDVQLKMVGNQFTADAFIEFSLLGKLQNSAAAGLASVSCGINEPMPKLQFTLPAKVYVGGQGQVIIDRGQWQLKWLRPCNLAPLNLNVETIANLPGVRGKIESTINEQLDQLPTILALKPHIEKAWPQIVEPKQVYPGMWLVLDPSQLGLGSITGNGRLVNTMVTVKARPRIVSSVEKPVLPLPPLPALGRADKVEGFHVALRGDINLAQANKLLNEQLANKPIDADGRTVLIEQIRVYGNEDKAVLGLKLKQPMEAEIYLLGKPVFNPEKNELSFEQLDFSLATSSALVNSAEWMLHGSFRDTLRARAKIAFDKDLAGAMDKLKALNFDLGQGASLRASVSRIQPRGVYFTGDEIKAIVAVDGKLAIDYGIK